jgi:gluconokinase
MLDKVRIHRAGRLPEAWVAAMGGDQNYDGICCRFLGISYEQITREVARQTSDEDLLEWAFVRGRRPSQEQILIWNAYMTKRNWRDNIPCLRFRLEEAKMPINAALTMFDFIDLDEDRPLEHRPRGLMGGYPPGRTQIASGLLKRFVVIIMHYLLITNILPQYDLARSSSFSSRSFRRSDARALDASERRSGVERARPPRTHGPLGRAPAALERRRRVGFPAGGKISEEIRGRKQKRPPDVSPAAVNSFRKTLTW